MDDLEGDAPGVGGDGGSPLVQGFAYLHFEAFAGGELEGDVGAGEQRVEDLVRGTYAHDDDVVGEVRVGGAQRGESLLVDAEGVRVVDCAVACDH